MYAQKLLYAFVHHGLNGKGPGGTIQQPEVCGHSSLLDILMTTFFCSIRVAIRGMTSVTGTGKRNA